MIELLGVEISQQALLVGLVTGLTYAAFAAGFVLIYRSTGVLNFAHGEMGAFNSPSRVCWSTTTSTGGLRSSGRPCARRSRRRVGRGSSFDSPRLVLLIADRCGHLLLARISWIPDSRRINSDGVRCHLGTDRSRLQARIVLPILLIARSVLTRTASSCRPGSASNPDTTVRLRTSPRRVSTTAGGGGDRHPHLNGTQAALVDTPRPSHFAAARLIVSLLARMLSRGVGCRCCRRRGRAFAQRRYHQQTIVDLFMFLAVLVVVLGLRSQR